LILILYMIGFGVPGLGLPFISYLPDVTYGVISLVLVYSAYVAEVYRAGIESVHESQNAAARSLGLTRWQAQIYSASEFNYASYVVAALLFVLITIPLARFTDRLIARDKRRREAGAMA
jgi:polar amino acid transport system permease protein